MLWASRDLDFEAVVTKKQRRTQLSRERAQRQTARRRQRELRRRRLRLALAAGLVALAVLGLVGWIVLHNDDSTSGRASGVYYDALPVHSTPTLNLEVTR